MKLSLCFVIFIFSFSIAHSQPADTTQSKFIFKSLYNYAIQEDVKSIFSILDTLPDDKFSESDLKLKEKYYSRFVNGNEDFDYNTEDRLVRDMIDIYKDYWTSVLLKQNAVEAADSALSDKLSEYLVNNYLDQKPWDNDSIKTDPMKYFSQLLSDNGYFNNVDGKTGNLFDIYIWKAQDTVRYDVVLPDGNISVPVFFMKDIITLGWEEYATMGSAYPGGWPRDGALFCVAKAYDTSKESFAVSYLSHEAQHFSDLKKYEEMPSWRLEYRAKLAELSKANETMVKILSNFVRGAKNDSTLSHPYAEYCVISDLSGKIFDVDYESDIEKWKAVDSGIINSTASALLQKDTSRLILKKED